MQQTDRNDLRGKREFLRAARYREEHRMPVVSLAPGYSVPITSELELKLDSQVTVSVRPENLEVRSADDGQPIQELTGVSYDLQALPTENVLQTDLQKIIAAYRALIFRNTETDEDEDV